MLAVANAALSASFQVLFDKIVSLTQESITFVREEQVLSEIKKWEKLLFILQAVLEDGEDKQLTSPPVKIWLEDLSDLAYDAEDVLDELLYECLRRQVTREETQASPSRVRRVVLPSCCSSFSTLKELRLNSEMLSKLDEVSTKLQEMAETKLQLDLKEKVVGAPRQVWRAPPTGCLPDEPQIYGRDAEKNEMLKLLLRNEPNDPVIGVIPIVGMGGVGKTTLARLVYNDDAVEIFDLKAWVCVSYDFDILRIMKGILEAINLPSSDLKELNAVQLKLHHKFQGKRFLLVLDDVWNGDYGDWNALRSPLMAAAPGSKIIVTTRRMDVARVMGTVKYLALGRISDDDCWSIFSTHALENHLLTAHQNLETMRGKIVSKCNGLPLAARALAGVLRSKEREEEWESLLESKVWSLKDEDSDILPVLWLSYYDLPSHLKRCFAYCAIYPQDYEFEEEQLVHLWMAEGLIQRGQARENGKEMEDVGREYFHDLVSRSIFQGTGPQKSKFVMHGLVSDLARRVAGRTCFIVEDQSMSSDHCRRGRGRVRHSSFIRGYGDGINRFEPFHNMKVLRTFLPLLVTDRDYFPHEHISKDVPFDLLPKLRRLRVLSLHHYAIFELPESIGGLKHLRYLDLSHTQLRSLPQSITSLYNLQTLLLKQCRNLNKLPSELGNLINLIHLDISGVDLQEGMPLGVKDLKCLRMLSDFVVGIDRGGSAVTELGNLKFLKGTLRISKLENVTKTQDARAANLIENEHLDVLLLRWCPRHDNSQNEEAEKEVLSGLQPDINLKELSIHDYCGKNFPSWVGNSSFHSLVVVNLVDCKRCTLLPRLGSLPSLKDLSIKGFSAVENIDEEFHGEGSLNPFAILETLRFEDMSEWNNWNPGEVQFPRLSKLSIESCPKLSGKLPKHLSSLKELEIRRCGELVVSLPSLPMISVLEIHECQEVHFGCAIDFGLLSYLELSRIPKFTSLLKEELVQGMKQLRSLCVREEVSTWRPFRNEHSRDWLFEDSPQLSFLLADEQEEEQLRLGLDNSKPDFLELRSFRSLTKLPQWICEKSLGGLLLVGLSALNFLPKALICSSPCLTYLAIEECDSLVTLEKCQLPPTLEKLRVGKCKNLERLLLDGDEATALELVAINGCPSITALSLNGEAATTLKSLEIVDCSELKSVSSGGKLPRGLERLGIWGCRNLESIAEKFYDATSLNVIRIVGCSKITHLPDDMRNLMKLQSLVVTGCSELFCFPSGGLPTMSLETLCISNCCVLPNNLHGITSLQSLWISDCPGINSFPEEGFPTNLKYLQIKNLNMWQQLFEWGLHRLASLKSLTVEGGPGGGCLDVVSFPRDEIGMTLPTSLDWLQIVNFPNLEYLSSRGFQGLTSLETLSLYHCPKLTSFPKNGLPPSLLGLHIQGCPLLKQRCHKGNKQEWSKVSHIPSVYIDGRFIFDPENSSTA